MIFVQNQFYAGNVKQYKRIEFSYFDYIHIVKNLFTLNQLLPL